MKATIIIAALVVLAGIIFGQDIREMFTGKEVGRKANKKTLKSKDQTKASEGVNIIDKWELPEELREVSGIAYLDNDRFACVQDEQGIIYFYNTRTGKIENQISFAGAGDFEGLAVKEKNAFVVRADGLLFEVDMATGKTKEYKTGLTIKDNVEGLGYDKSHDRLLLAGKDQGKDQSGYKSIYAFNLSDRSFQTKAVYTIDLSHEVLQSTFSGKKKNTLMPSALAVHPVTGEIYIIDGPKSKLLVLDRSGIPTRVFSLGNEFAQPEGITFSPTGELFISNEGKKNSGNIIKVDLK